MGTASSSVAGHPLCVEEVTCDANFHRCLGSGNPGEDFEGKDCKIEDEEIWSTGVWTDILDGDRCERFLYHMILGKGMKASTMEKEWKTK